MENVTLTARQEEFEAAKGVIRIRISKTDRQHIDQKKKYKRTNHYLQNITHKTKDRVKRTPVKSVVNSGSQERYYSDNNQLMEYNYSMLIAHICIFLIIKREHT